jgi:hypothetical protein
MLVVGDNQGAGRLIPFCHLSQYVVGGSDNWIVNTVLAQPFGIDGVNDLALC